MTDPIADLDQYIAGLKDMAHIMRRFHLALLDEGFTEQDALHLVGAWCMAVVKEQS